MKDKPRYNILQNLIYLLKTCWRVSKGLLWMILAMTILQLLTNMAELYIAPIVLQKVEQSAPLREVLLTIGGFTLALAVFVGARSYLEETKCIFDSRFFNHFILAQAMKAATTSYANTMDTTFMEKREQSGNRMTGDAGHTPPLEMLTRANEFITACIGFALYLLVLTGLHPVLIVMVIVTTVIGFSVNRYVNKKKYETHSERQRYKDAPFIILDEPTAALDPIAEAEIYEKFDGIAGDKTAIYISHRLSSCKFCDEIAVFHEGTVIQQGTHAELVSDETGKYYELWHAQAQYYTEQSP